MDISPPALVFAAIAAVAAAVWLWGLTYLLATARLGRADAPAAERFAAEEERPARDLLTGAAEVEGRADDLAAKATATLAQFGTAGVLKILHRGDDRIVFEGLGRGNMGPAAVGIAAGRFRRGEIRLTPLSHDRTRVEYVVEVPNGRGLLWAGAIVQALGLVALIAGAWAIVTFVLPSHDPAVRWQAVQMVQVVHFLWPPFLCGALYRQLFHGNRNGFDALVHSLPYTARTDGAGGGRWP